MSRFQVTHPLLLAELGRLTAEDRREGEAFGTEFTLADTYGREAYASMAGRFVPADTIDRNEAQTFLWLSYSATYVRDRFKCQYCDADGLTYDRIYPCIEVDHLVPVHPRDSGVWPDDPVVKFALIFSPENLACACTCCNKRKQNRLWVPTQWLKAPWEAPRSHRIAAIREELEAPHPDGEREIVRGFLESWQAGPGVKAPPR